MPHGSMTFCASNNNLRQNPDVMPGLVTRACAQGAVVMRFPQPRFQLRTILIVIATLAAVISLLNDPLPAVIEEGKLGVKGD